MKHRFKSIDSAAKRVRQLEKIIDRYEAICVRMNYERFLMAGLASERPEFFNPLVIGEAKKMRDRILAKKDVPINDLGELISQTNK